MIILQLSHNFCPIIQKKLLYDKEEENCKSLLFCSPEQLTNISQAFLSIGLTKSVLDYFIADKYKLMVYL